MEGPAKVTLVEVGPRDGLQNEKTPIALEHKLALIERLAACGLKVIEATAFVSPQWVPQMADHAEVMRALRGRRRPGVRHPVLVPNLKGLEAALAAGVDEIAVFGAASETFSRKNINCGIAEALERFRPVVAQARAAGVRVRGYVSCVVGCPYEGPVAPEKVAEVAAAYFRLMALDNELSIVRRTLITRSEGAYQAQLRFEGGLTSETVFQQAKVEYASTAALIPDLEAGMRPKMEACLAAVRGGVPSATVIDGRVPHSVLADLDGSHSGGTTVVPDERSNS